MGPNGSGKSTLAQVLARRESYEVTDGQVTLNGKDLLAMKPEEAACEGLLIALRSPSAGISNAYFLPRGAQCGAQASRTGRTGRNGFSSVPRRKMRLLDMDERFLNRPVNEGFSGGEKEKE